MEELEDSSDGKAKATYLLLLLLALNQTDNLIQDHFGLRPLTKFTSHERTRSFSSHTSDAASETSCESGRRIEDTRSIKRGPKGRKRQTSKKNNNKDDDDEDDDPSRLSKRKAYSGILSMGKNLACPYAKADPLRNLSCLEVNRRNLTGIK